MNSRAKGQRNERRVQRALEASGYVVFRLYQPVMADQGPIDMVAVKAERVLLVQVRSNRWGDLRPLVALKVKRYAKVIKEVWRVDDRVRTFKTREIP